MTDSVAGNGAEIDPETARCAPDSDRRKARIVTELAGPRWGFTDPEGKPMVYKGAWDWPDAPGGTVDVYVHYDDLSLKGAPEPFIDEVHLVWLDPREGPQRRFVHRYHTDVTGWPHAEAQRRSLLASYVAPWRVELYVKLFTLWNLYEPD